MRRAATPPSDAKAVRAHTLGRRPALVCGLLGLDLLLADSPDLQRRPAPEEVDALVDHLGELLIVGVSGLELDESALSDLQQLRPGGILLYRNNIASEQQLLRLTAQISQRFSGELSPPFIAIDQEGGTVNRIDAAAASLPGAMALGAARSEELAFEAGLGLGAYLRNIGITMNFAPVLEPAMNPQSRAIGLRAFSDRPELVASLGTAFIKGQDSAGVVSVAKHFPGHGDSLEDSHETLPRFDGSRGRIRQLVSPFQTAIAAGLDAVMTAHVSVPGVSGSDEPATTSSAVLTGLLRRELGFGGIIVTDALIMKSVLLRSGFGGAAVDSLAAGADMLVVANGPETLVLRAVERALRTGRLPIERIREALTRIRGVKRKRLGRFASPGTSSPAGRSVAEASITVLKNDGLLPASRDRIAVLTTSSAFADSARALVAKDAVLLARKGGLWGDVTERPPSVSDLLRVRELAKHTNVAVVAIINPIDLPLFEAARKHYAHVIFVSLGRPILVESALKAGALVLTYSYVAASATAALEVIFGVREARGKLPIGLPSFAFGSGM